MALELSFRCCGLSLQRVVSRPSALDAIQDSVSRAGEGAAQAIEGRRSSPWINLPTIEGPRAPLFGRDGEEMAVVKVIAPRENEKDALVVENILGSLAVSPTPFSLEIVGEMGERSLQVRGTPDMVEHIIEQLQAAYGQVECEVVQGQSGEGTLETTLSSELERAQGILTLRRDRMYPLRTWDEFREGDPIATLLGAFGGLKERERVLSQLVLRPARDDWADDLQGAAREIDWRLKTASLPGQMKTFLFALGLGGGFFYLVMAIALLRSGQLLRLLGLTLLAGGLGYLGYRLYRHFSKQLAGDPRVIQRKVSRPAFRCQVRLTAVSPNGKRAQRLLGRLVGAYRLFNLAEGNGFVFRQQAFDPSSLEVDKGLLSSMLGGDSACILNTAEVAGLWHLPMGGDVELVRRSLFRRFLPLPEEVRQRAGSIHIGHSIHHGRDFPVYLPPEAAEGNMLLVAKTQQGKSTLLQHLAAAALHDRGRSVVVIDPHSDLVRSLLGLIPEDRLQDVIYIDLSQEERSVGVNIFDVTTGVPRDKIVADLIRIGEKLWPDYWGPRMEDALRYTSLALVEANEHLVRLGQPEDQFTILDIPFLLTLKHFRLDVLTHHVSDPQVSAWWYTYYEPLEHRFQQEIINPVQTKIHRFMASHATRNVVGQPRSTVNMHSCLTEHKIVLMNTASGVIGVETGGFLGAVLLNYLEAAIRSQQQEVRERRVPVTCIIDEFQSIPGVDYAALLGELRKMGANFALATQTLAQLDAVDRTLRPSVLANIDTLMAFQTSAEDARALSFELDSVVEVADIINLDRFQCYLKTVSGKKRLPVLLVSLLAPLEGLEERARGVRGQMTHYTRAAEEVQADLEAHMLRHYHLEKIGHQGSDSLQVMMAEGSRQHEAVPTEAELSSALQEQAGEARKEGKVRVRPRSYGAAT